MGNAVAKVEKPSYGPAMTALNPRQRIFVDLKMRGEPGPHNTSAAVLGAGYLTPDADPKLVAASAHKLLSNPKVVDALIEVSRQMIRTDGPEAVATVREILRDKSAKGSDRLKAASMVLDRTDPTEQKIAVTHEQIDHEKDLLAYLRHRMSQGDTPEQLEREFGYSDLPRLQALLADKAKPAQVIEAEFKEVEDEEEVEWTAL